jgi:hypothetical protein
LGTLLSLHKQLSVKPPEIGKRFKEVVLKQYINEYLRNYEVKLMPKPGEVP